MPTVCPRALEIRRLSEHSRHRMSADEIIYHMARHFGPVEPLSLQEIVPVTGIAIHVIRPHSDDNLILFTTGMSDRKQSVPKGQEEFQYTELMLRLPGDWPLERLEEPANFWPIEWLKKIAWYPHDNETWLGGPFAIIANGEPPESLGADTKLSCLLLLCETDALKPNSLPKWPERPGLLDGPSLLGGARPRAR
jgi:Suppressor of fused protein (SUFU)